MAHASIAAPTSALNFRRAAAQPDPGDGGSTLHSPQDLHDAKRDVLIYDYVDRDVPFLARMAAKRAAGYSPLGYTIAEGPGLFDRPRAD